MGRKKISITRLTDERNRQITFSKRKAGLLKKAYELSILCDVEIAVIMITSNSKLYQYASSNMNSILIRYTDFKDPDESKTNADILDDITKKDNKSSGQDDSGDEDSAPPPGAPSIVDNYRRIDKEFDHLLHGNVVPNHPSAITPLGSAPPSVMPVTVPVGAAASPGTVQQQIQQHLQSQLEGQQKMILSANLSSGSLPSSSNSTLFSPQSDLSSASPLSSVRGPRSPSSMPAPLTTPTRLQTLRNQTLKLHLPGSGRNYISLSTGGSGSAGGEGPFGKMGEDDADDGRNDGEDSSRPGTKPQLRVFIPGQKEFVPRTQETSPLSQVAVTSQQATENDGGGGGRVVESGGGGAAGGGGGVEGGGGLGVAHRKGAGVSVCTAISLSKNTESLTTPVLSLTTPNVFSSLPPIFSSLLGDFPFNQTPISNATAPLAMSGGGGVGGGGGGGGGGENSSAALVAFPVSIQPSATGAGSTNAGNLILQAQNMGQPFLLTPTYDSRQNPLMNSQSFATPPPSSGLGGSSGGISSGVSSNLEHQLKQQYERTQQLIQQQLFYTQMQMLHQQQSKEGGGADGASTAVVGTAASMGGVGGRSPLVNTVHPPAIRGGLVESIQASSSSPSSSASTHPSQFSSEGGGSTVRSLPQFINGSDVLISSLAVRKPRQTAESGSRAIDESAPSAKKSRLESSPGTDS